MSGRRIVPISGPREWCLAEAPDVPRATGQLLGQEFDALVFDAWAGFDPDAFGAALGTIRAGGTLYLLTPPLDAWPDYADPERDRIAAWPFEATDVGGRFLRRFVRFLTEFAQPADPLADDPPKGWVGPSVGGRTRGCARTEDQGVAVAALVKVGRGRRRRPVVLTSDRGRGKSAALGLATAELLAERPRRIVVTGPSRRAVEPVFRHAGDVGGALRFVPPGELLPALGDADVVWVDEAATLPVPLLERLLRGHPRIAFSTTEHGYEGTGRGFALRFREVLDRVTPDWRAVRMETPIRFPENDPLERFGFRALLLDADPAPDEAAGVECTVEKLERDELAADERLLSELFGLLVLAHYRTRPSDLRRLLDAPNLAVWALRHGAHVMGTALVATEGGFDAEMCTAIHEGRRRPRAHLLPETLTAHVGLRDAASLRCARVVRIAIHPAVRGRGLGTRLLNAVAADAEATGLDYVGSSFGATGGLLRFWTRAELWPVRLGVTRGTTSGAHSAVVLRGLSDAGRTLEARARRRFARHFPHQLTDALRQLEPAVVVALLRASLIPEATLDEDDRADVTAFAQGHRVYDVCSAPVFDLVLGALANRDVAGADVLVAKVLQARSWAEVAEALTLPGHAGVARALREAVAPLVALRL